MVKALSLLIGLGLVAAVLWVAAEMHYRSCVDAAKASLPYVPEEGFFGKVDANSQPRAARIAGCSRLPF